MQANLIRIGRIISGLLALFLTMSAVMKLMAGTAVTEGMARFGLPASLRVPLGIRDLSSI